MSYSGSQMQPVTAKISSDDGLTISRTMPTMLSDQMSNIHWATLCEEIDEALKPAALMKKLSLWRMISGVSGFAILVLLITLSATAIVGIPYWTIFVVPVIVFGLQYYLEERYKANRTMIVTALTEVCNRANEKYPEVTFKVNEDVKVMRWRTCGRFSCGSDRNNPDGGYIEVTKYTKATTTSTATKVNTPGPLVPLKKVGEDDVEAGLGLGTKGKKSREERLEALDGMKNQLSEDEYYAKRAEIQSDV